ncbi:MAG: RNA 2',3'-cyclic phosphodiesterase [Verrucomicrobiota bacterium]
MADLRLFLAVPVPVEIQQVLGATLGDLRDALGREGWRWVAPGNLHLTLRFLGDLPVEAVAEIQGRMASAVAGVGPIPVVGRGIGGFPPGRSPRVLWVAVDSAGQAVSRLQERLARATADLGEPEREGGWIPHITLARSRPGGKVRGSDWEHLQERYRTVEFGRWTADAVDLLASEPGPLGPRYSRVGGVALTG